MCLLSFKIYIVSSERKFLSKDIEYFVFILD